MFRVTHTCAALALLLVIAATVCVQRPARANDTGALIGGLIAGAIVYELLDDDDDGYCHRRYYDGYYYPRGYYRPPTYYRSYPRYYRPSGGVTIWYDECYPSRRTYSYRDYGPSYRYGDGWRAPSHAKRNVGPPPGYGKPGKRGGGKYRPPKCYR